MDAAGRRYRDLAHRCMRCGACMEVCPTYRVTGRESHVARGRLVTAEAFFAGELAPDAALEELMSRCLGCTACEAVCPSGVSVSEIVAAARGELAGAALKGRLGRAAARRFFGRDEGRPPLAWRLLATAESSVSRRLPGTRRTLPAPAPRPLSRLLPEVSRPRGAVHGRVVFYPGCAINVFYPATGTALVKILNRLGVEVVIPRGWQCCGLPHRSQGDMQAARQLALANQELLLGLDADAVVTACSSCALSLKRGVPGISGAAAERSRRLAELVVDVHSYLAGLDVAAAAADGGALKVTFHDPCHLRRGLGVFREPRDILQHLPGVEYLETAGDNDCCGGGGLFGVRHYRLALEIGAGRAEALAASGAQVVATACPSCRAHLTDLFNRGGYALRVVHTLELMAGEGLPKVEDGFGREADHGRESHPGAVSPQR